MEQSSGNRKPISLLEFSQQNPEVRPSQRESSRDCAGEWSYWAGSERVHYSV